MWLDGFPIPSVLLPPRFKELVGEVSIANPEAQVEIVARLELDRHGPEREDLLMQTAVVPVDQVSDLRELRRKCEFSHVSSSLSGVERYGEAAEFSPSIGGHDYLVASWGSNSFFTYNLSEKVWMGLGLSARTLGGDHQSIVYDDLVLPLMGVARGEASSQYYYQSSRDVTWTIRNDYVRRYLWMRGAMGVRVFYYSKLLPPKAELLKVLGGKNRFGQEAEDGRYELDLLVDDHGVLMQVWGVAPVLAPQLCAVADAEALIWPGFEGPMTSERARGPFAEPAMVHLSDEFLDRYEQDAMFDSGAVQAGAHWYVGPRYGGQWAFSDCVRVGRNAIRVPLRKLYEGLPDREIIHAHRFALGPAAVAAIKPDQPHVAELTKRIVAALLDLGECVAALGDRIGVVVDADHFLRLSRTDIVANQWLNYPELRRLSRVAPLNMTQSAFLSRCKSLSELIGRLSGKPLKAILRHCGCSAEDLRNLRSLRLLQAILTISQEINACGGDWTSLQGSSAEVDWKANNPDMTPIVMVNELRNAEAHENLENIMEAIAALDIDTAFLNEGYGAALDHVFHRCAETLQLVSDQLRGLLAD